MASTEVSHNTRAITQEEADHYRDNGWVKLERLVDESFAQVILDRFLSSLENDPSVDQEQKLGEVFRVYDHVSNRDEALKSFAHSKELGSVASALMKARDELGGLSGSVRCLQDQMLGKVPVTQGGTKTPWHHDFILLPFDRAGGMVIWIALGDIPPERGSLRFFSGSHRLPPLGRVFHRKDGLDLADEYPGLSEKFEISPPLTLRPGDATVHDYCTVHSAPPNTTDAVRWVYLVEFIPAEALYTGQPHRITNDLNLPIDQPPDHPLFPIIPLDSDVAQAEQAGAD